MREVPHGGRLSDDELLQLAFLLARFASHDLDQFENWRVQTPDGAAYVRVSRQTVDAVPDELHTTIWPPPVRLADRVAPTKTGRATMPKNSETEPPRGWVWTGNLRPFLESISALIGYSFDDWDWAAVDAGVQGTDIEANGTWFLYPLGEGDPPMQVEIAADPGTEVTHIRLANSTGGAHDAGVTILLSVFSLYRLTAT